VLSDIGADAIKTGMLANAGIIAVIARMIRKYHITKVVVDPVMLSKSGHALLAPEARSALIEKLLPLALIVTPNLAEASRLAGFPVRTLGDMKRAAQAIRKLGAKNVLVKGGHLPGSPIDVLLAGREIIELRGKRITTPCTHGTGCALASAIATLLAQGHGLVESVRAAKACVANAIKHGLRVGKGVGVMGVIRET
jgi:hydroxymethylpyrimidine/phosphomethylpyrimidine kinase